VSGHKALACSACHGGSISSDVYIIDGKREEDVTSSGEEGFVYEVKIPVGYGSIVQLFASNDEIAYDDPKVEIDYTDVLKDLRGSALFNAVNLFEGKSFNGFTSVNVSYTFEEAIKETKTFILQGVISNNDGTVNGDHTFYKEIVIEHKESSIQAANLSIASDKIYYNNNQVIVSSPGKTQQVQIIDLQGKVVYNTIVDGYGVIDVSTLNQGIYLVVSGNTKETLQTMKFLK
jgi:hypothetical protein